MDLQKLRQGVNQLRHDVTNAVSVRNKVDVKVDDKTSLTDLAKPFKHHVVQGKYLRYKNGKLYSKQFSPTEFLARIGDKPSIRTIREQSQAAMSELAKRVDGQYGAGTADRIGLMRSGLALTSRTLEDLDYHAAAAAALHELGVCHDASVQDRDTAIQVLKLKMREQVADGAGQADPKSGLRELARQCARQLHAIDVKELELAQKALLDLAPNFKGTDDKNAFLQIKVAMQALTGNPAESMPAEQAAQACAVRYHRDLAKAETTLAAMGLITATPVDGVQWPGKEALQVVASAYRPPLSGQPQAVELAVLRWALSRLQPAMDENAIKSATDELLADTGFSLDKAYWDCIEATYEKHKSVRPHLLRQTRIDGLLKQSQADPQQLNALLKQQLQYAADNATDASKAFSVQTHIGKTMASLANQAEGMDAFLGPHLSRSDVLITGLPPDLTTFDQNSFFRQLTDTFKDIFSQGNIAGDLPPQLRQHLKTGMDAIADCSRTDAEKEALQKAWSDALLARYVLAPAIERYALALASDRADAATAAALVRMNFLKMIDGPSDAERARMQSDALQSWEDCLAAWRALLAAAQN